MQKVETIDLTPSTAGTLRLWAEILKGAIKNIEGGKKAIGLGQIDAVVEDLLKNAKEQIKRRG